jgi:DNA-binding transcriptional LysR family regulator
MNLDDLTYFLALVREGTMSGAGRKLKVKHTTVARRIASLEGDLGCRLFDRTPDGQVLTQAGENLHRHALKIEDQAFEAERDILGGDARLEGTLKLTAPYDFFCSVVAPHLHEFTTAYPGIELETICSTAFLDLATLEADIAIRITETPPDYLIGKKIMPLSHGIYASKKYLREKSPRDTLILWRGERDLPGWAKEHFPDAEVILRTDEATTMVAAVTHHMGIARMPCYIADAEPTLRRIDRVMMPSRWGIWVLNHVDLRTTARVSVCKEFVVSLIEKQSVLIGGNASVY